ncbi:MAG: hypothetical protein MI741_20200, partial [Rhodospirillales bacterium]|nr:hypothetical protein [Rhodospirillales bacterium]
KRITRIIRVDDQQQIETELSEIRRALLKGAALQPHPYLERGMHVEVRSGPFRGMKGVIEDFNRANRLILQVQTLGQASSLEIDGSLLEPVEKKEPLRKSA